jgi:hypothetical protein
MLGRELTLWKFYAMEFAERNGDLVSVFWEEHVLGLHNFGVITLFQSELTISVVNFGTHSKISKDLINIAFLFSFEEKICLKEYILCLVEPNLR